MSGKPFEITGMRSKPSAGILPRRRRRRAEQCWLSMYCLGHAIGTISGEHGLLVGMVVYTSVRGWKIVGVQK